jgi:predicted dehydrogenase
MGTSHARGILGGKVPGMVLSALCDESQDRLASYDSAIPRFSDPGQMIRSGEIDAILIATPHYSHTDIGIDALENGIHTMVEKPISVHKADCEKLIAAHKDPKVIFAAMFNQRTDGKYKKLRQLIKTGELGEIRRANWIITDWFRTEAYYASGGWRATWAGEGGGVLLNQCPHNLDLWQWMLGMPNKVRAFCGFGKYHDIEVEDEVTAYMEYDSGATGVFITTTGEAPGTNRLEIVGERGKVVAEGSTLKFYRNEVGALEFSRSTKEGFARPPVWECDIPISGHGGQHMEILNNFTAAILKGAELIAPAEEGIHSVELANSMIYSGLKQETVALPLDSKEYSEELDRLRRESRFVKKTRDDVVTNFASSVVS